MQVTSTDFTLFSGLFKKIASINPHFHVFPQNSNRACWATYWDVQTLIVTLMKDGEQFPIFTFCTVSEVTV